MPWQTNNTFIIDFNLLKMPWNAQLCGVSWLFFISFISVSWRQIIANFSKLLPPLSSQVSSQIGKYQQPVIFIYYIITKFRFFETFLLDIQKFIDFSATFVIIKVTHLTCLEGESGFRMAITGFFILCTFAFLIILIVRFIIFFCT